MTIAPGTLRWALVLALPLAAAAALRANDADRAPGEDAIAARRPLTAGSAERSATRDPALPRLELDRLQTLARRHVSVQEPVDPFAAERPAASTTDRAAAAPAPAPAPQAPPLPFRFIGRQEADGVPLIFLEQQQQTHIVRIGETVTDGWRLDAADVRELVFTYVPLGQQRTLATGSPG